MSARVGAALLAGRTAAALSRRLGRGGGTVIAGHVVSRVAPGALRHVTRALSQGSIVVSATNGKTTTTRMISHVLRGAGFRTLHNRSGANLLTGLYTAVAQQTDLFGRPDADFGVFEVDEATLPRALAHVTPRVLLLHNIFRDQLDRYGEVHFVARLWREAVQKLSPDTTLLLNADDPLLADLARVAAGPVVLYGLEDRSQGSPVTPHASDARLCPLCGAALDYTVTFYGHLGHYRCSRCEFARSTPQLAATDVRDLGTSGSDVLISTPWGALREKVGLPGLYNVYNALAATAVCMSVDVSADVVARGLETFTAAFGRLEQVQVEDRNVFLALVKNPVGFTEVLRTILAEPGLKTILFAINDQFADGTDVSWLWDVELELLQDRVNLAVASGLRAEDMAVRLKYAGVDTNRIRVEPDARRALESALAAAEPGETVYVLPTYTAMLGLRELLRQTGYVKEFWQD